MKENNQKVRNIQNKVVRKKYETIGEEKFLEESLKFFQRIRESFQEHTELVLVQS